MCLPLYVIATADFLPKLLENPSYNMVSHNQGTKTLVYHYLIILLLICKL